MLRVVSASLGCGSKAEQVLNFTGVSVLNLQHTYSAYKHQPHFSYGDDDY